MMNWQKLIIIGLFCCSWSFLEAKEIPSHKVLSNDELVHYLNDETRQGLMQNGGPDNQSLARFYRDQFALRFFYNYQTVQQRFKLYSRLYNNENMHRERAKDHMSKFADSAIWKLPCNYLDGSPVNAYAIRHLARQHKMMDIAYLYFYDQQDPKYINYWHTQLRSLNAALQADQYETIKGGNGVYEAFRSGYRVLNWLSIHNLFLGEEAYSDEMQLQTIATLLQHGAHLYSSNKTFTPGNHQTRGMSALAMLAILFRDFEGTDKWYEHAMHLLNEHLTKEINPDGFQFERSVHYHMSDIANYFYVYQLAKNSDIEVDPLWEAQLRSLFTTLGKLAYPDKSAPVLQDDTDDPWAEKNNIGGTMTLGYLLFGDPQMGYFAEQEVRDRIYWFLKQEQLDGLNAIQMEKPEYGSLSFPDTHYYIMREGWQKDDKMMIISAGLDKEKPDHQHGDMLGVQAMAMGKTILPNYQVRYSLSDYDVFKNSLVKNVALVDNELQGQLWTSNKGGSGFGKFKSLPHPTTIDWTNNEDFDLFVGSHDGFENKGVRYSRQVIYVKNNFWIVKDNFQSDKKHTYKQVWQGHYTHENGPDLIRSTFSDASGCDILQLIQTDTVTLSGTRGKQWNIVSKTDQLCFSFISIIYPYRGFENRIDEEADYGFNGWQHNSLPFKSDGENVCSLSSGTTHYVFNVQSLNLDNRAVRFSEQVDLHLKKINEGWLMHLLSANEVEMEIQSEEKSSKYHLAPGEENIIR